MFYRSIWLLRHKLVIDFLTFIYFFTAQLLCKNYYYWWAEEDRHLLQAAHCLRWRNHLRLQISHWRWENFVSVWFQKLQKISQLETNFVSRFLFVSPSFGQQDLWFKKSIFLFRCALCHRENSTELLHLHSYLLHLLWF